MSRKDYCNPKFWRTFALTHSSFRWTGSNWFVGEYANENLTFTLQEAGDGNSAGFNLIVFQPAAVKHLETKVTEIQLIRTGSVTTAVSALGLTIFYSTGKKGHRSVLGIRFLKRVGTIVTRREQLRQLPPEVRCLRQVHGCRAERAHHGGVVHRGHHDVHDGAPDGEQHFHQHSHG
jgi:hypothetical protein